MRVIMPSMGRAVLPMLLVAGLAGCGGGDDAPDRAATVPTQTTERRPAPPSPTPSPLLAPQEVPRTGTGDADPADVAVLQRWLRAVREGRIAGAARLLAPGAKVQNGTPVLTLKTQEDRELWTASLPCGARIASVLGARGYLVVEYELTPRAGADCGSGAGGSARGAVEVVGGKITGWYRLEEAPRVGDGPGRVAT